MEIAGTRIEVLKKAGDFLRLGQITEAEELYQSAYNSYPEDPVIMHCLGLVYAQKGYNGMAATLFLRSKEYDPSVMDNYFNLGTVKQREGFFEEAEHYFQEGVRISELDAPVTIQAAAYAALGGLYINEGQPEKCLEYSTRAFQLMPAEHHKALEWVKFNMALAYLEMGNWRKGFREYHDAVKRRQRQNRNYSTDGQTPTPTWAHQKNKFVAVFGEQGVGDEVMFASCLQEFADDSKHVLFECHPRLINIFSRSFPDIECYPTRKQNTRMLPQTDKIEYCIPIGSLPIFYRKTNADFPNHSSYLKTDPERVLYYRERLAELGPGPYVGIAWEGGTKSTRYDLRSIPLKWWESLLQKEGRFVSINYFPGSKETAAKHGIIHWPKAVDDLDEQFALIEACDLIVSVNQSLVHFAGSLGKKAFVLTPYGAAWRYGIKGQKMIWYPSITQFRQANRGDGWGNVMIELCREYDTFLHGYHESNHNRARAISPGSEEGAGDR